MKFKNLEKVELYTTDRHGYPRGCVVIPAPSVRSDGMAIIRLSLLYIYIYSMHTGNLIKLLYRHIKIKTPMHFNAQHHECLLNKL